MTKAMDVALAEVFHVQDIEVGVTFVEAGQGNSFKAIKLPVYVSIFFKSLATVLWSTTTLLT